MRARLILTFTACLFAGCGGQAIENESSPDASTTGTPDATTDSAPSISDAGPPPMVIDGCVDIVLSTYDQSCQKSSDCIGITAGEICTGSCECGGAVINVSGEARYNQAISGIQGEACPCPPPPMPVCIEGTCTTCLPGFPGSCPDAG